MRFTDIKYHLLFYVIFAVALLMAAGNMSSRPMQTPEMDANELTNIVTSKLGWHWYVMTRVKAFPPKVISVLPTDLANPFVAPVTITRQTIWYYDRIEVGITTLMKEDPFAVAAVKYDSGGMPIAFDVTPQRVYDTLKAGLPQVKWDK